jgi:hypothetical protein
MREWAMAAALGLAACGWSCGGRTVVVVDRVEEGMAVLVDERGQQLAARAEDRPSDAVEGAVLVNGEVDEAERRRMVQEAQERRARLLDDDGCDLDLSRAGR